MLTPDASTTGAVRLALLSGGGLLLTGLLLGIWKYVAIRRSPDAVAPEYVSIAHRAALMYAFACGLIAQLLQPTALTEDMARACVIGLVASFVVAVGSYVLHGALRDTDNQFRAPHTLGPVRVHSLLVDAIMVLKGGVELVATVTVLTGFALALPG